MSNSEKPVSKWSATAIARLPVAERVRLLGVIWDSLAAERDGFALTSEQLSEMTRRLDEHRAQPTTSLPRNHVAREMKAVLAASSSGRKPSRKSSKR